RCYKVLLAAGSDIVSGSRQFKPAITALVTYRVAPAKGHQRCGRSYQLTMAGIIMWLVAAFVFLSPYGEAQDQYNLTPVVVQFDKGSFEFRSMRLVSPDGL